MEIVTLFTATAETCQNQLMKVEGRRLFQLMVLEFCSPTASNPHPLDLASKEGDERRGYCRTKNYEDSSWAGSSFYNQPSLKNHLLKTPPND